MSGGSIAVEQKTPWWKYQPSTLKNVRLTLASIFLVAGCVHGLRYSPEAAQQNAGMFAIMYLCLSAAMFWLALRTKE